MRRPLFAAALLLGLAAPPAAAQGAVLMPQGIVQAGFIGSARPALTAGVRLTRTPLPPEPERDPETGMPLPVSAPWSMQLLATAGVTFAEPRDRNVDFTALASLAALRPIGAGVLGGVGPALMGSYRPDGLGPGIRVETLLRAIGAQAGVLWPLDGGDPAAAVTIDLAASFLTDLVRR